MGASDLQLTATMYARMVATNLHWPAAMYSSIVAIIWQTIRYCVLANGRYQLTGTCSNVNANGYLFLTNESCQLAVVYIDVLANGCYQFAVYLIPGLCKWGLSTRSCPWKRINERLLPIGFLCPIISLRTVATSYSTVCGTFEESLQLQTLATLAVCEEASPCELTHSTIG